MNKYYRKTGVMGLRNLPNKMGGSLSIIGSTSTPVPEAPTGDAATDITDVSFTANWSAPGAGQAPTGYRLYVYESDGVTPVSGYDGLDVGLTLSYPVESLSDYTVYKYDVAAYTGGGPGPHSSPQISLTTFDSDAWAFIVAIATSNETIKTAINFRATSLKGRNTSYNPSAFNLWDMIPTDYPLVGGTGTTNKFNLKDPQNTDAAYRISFTGTGNHVIGYTSNGTNGSGNTHITPADLGQNTGGYYFYSRTSGSENKQSFTVQTGGSDEFGIYRRYSDNNSYVACNSGEQTRANSDGSGFFVVSRSAANLFNIMIRGSNSTSALASAAPPAFNITISAKNLSGVISQFSVTNFASFGTLNQPLSTDEMTALTNIDVQFQTILGRNV